MQNPFMPPEDDFVYMKNTAAIDLAVQHDSLVWQFPAGETHRIPRHLAGHIRRQYSVYSGPDGGPPPPCPFVEVGPETGTLEYRRAELKRQQDSVEKAKEQLREAQEGLRALDAAYKATRAAMEEDRKVPGPNEEAPRKR